MRVLFISIKAAARAATAAAQSNPAALASPNPIANGISAKPRTAITPAILIIPSE